MRIVNRIGLLASSLTWLFLAVLPARCETESFDWTLAGKIAVQSGGRIKPLNTYARELVKTIYGKSAYQGQDPVETYFRWMADGEYWAVQPLFYVPKSGVRSEMGLMSVHGNYFSMMDLEQHRELVHLAIAGQARVDAGEKATFSQTKASELLGRMHTLSAVFSHGEPRYVPMAENPDAEWLPATELIAMLEDTAEGEPLTENNQYLALAFAGLYNSVRDNRPDIFNTAVQVFVRTQQEVLSEQSDLISKLNWENRYNSFDPFFYAKLLLITGFVLYILSLRSAWAKLNRAGFVAVICGLVLYTAGMGMRALIAGRAPWSNMYESLLAIGWALLIFSVIFEAIRRDRLFGIAGSILAALILGLAQFASLDRGINPLVPALQSYWLNYHVIITLSGYACFALAMAVGHGVLISGVRSKGQMTPALAGLTKANLRIIQIGSLFLIAGILLGAVWANASWGRFWGWDPKETWALICWFVYIVFLHGRSAGWLAWRGLAVASVAAFPVVIMTYYGVNYYLSGLHSYGAGSSPGIPWQVFAYLALEMGFLTWAIVKLRGTVPPRPQKNRTVSAATS